MVSINAYLRKSMKQLLFLLALCFLLLSIPLSAHVSYVLDEQTLSQERGRDDLFFFSPLQDSSSVSLIIFTLVILAGLYALLIHLKPWTKEIQKIRTNCLSYLDFIPWIARLGLGIALIGAGVSQVLVTPVVTATSFIAALEMLFGFLILAGFFLPYAILGSLALYIVGLTLDVYLLGNLDFFALGLVVFILGSSKPGIDHLIGIPFSFYYPSLHRYVPLLARIGVGGSLIFLALYEKFLNPSWFASVVEQYGLYLAIPVSVSMWVFSAGAIELVVGLFLLLGFKTRLMSVVAFFVLSASFFYFHEAIFSHVTLFAILSLLFITGSGEHSIDHWLLQLKPTILKKKKRR